MSICNSSLITNSDSLDCYILKLCRNLKDCQRQKKNDCKTRHVWNLEVIIEEKRYFLSLQEGKKVGSFHCNQCTYISDGRVLNRKACDRFVFINIRNASIHFNRWQNENGGGIEGIEEQKFSSGGTTWKNVNIEIDQRPNDSFDGGILLDLWTSFEWRYEMIKIDLLNVLECTFRWLGAWRWLIGWGIGIPYFENSCND